MRSQHHITSGRASLFAETAGRGDPVVFLHAAICDSRMWEAQMGQVAKTNTAIAYDRRGHGRTRAEVEDYSAVADLVAVLDTLAEGKPAILVGCSQGARVALDAALLHPSRVRGLVLISPTVAGAADPVHSPAVHELMEELKRAGAAGDQERINALKARLFLDGPFEQEGRVSGAARTLFLEMNGAILSAPYRGSSIDNVAAYQRLGEIEVPTLVLWGACDFPHIQARSRQVAALLPYGIGTELPCTAHLPSLDRPAELNARLAAFIASAT
ncbi:MAG TPA: alpha/beta hydrolase [Achromobacter sp.]|nr:alpha/beta hydrolase [Achromobacter sp.]HCQ45271.1 alpha/beta hydrolase [Achromobacter sp.]